MGVNVIYLKLATRKNRPYGSLLKRTCWCAQNKDTCPVHVLGNYVQGLGKGCQLFPGLTPGIVNSKLRSRLECLGITDARNYRAHDLRRGHADDLRLAKRPLKEILQAGEWRSPAFLQYLDIESMDDDFVLSAHLDESSGDES